MDTLALLEKELHARYEGSAHRQTLVQLALADIRSALSSLGHLGHHYDLVESEVIEPEEFPKMFYHKDGKQTLVVHDLAVAEGLSDDWQDKPVGAEEFVAKPDSAPAEAPSPEMLSLDDEGKPVIVSKGKSKPVIE